MAGMSEPSSAQAEAAAGPRYQPLVIVAAAVCTGIVADRAWPLPVGIWWSAALALCGAWYLLWGRGKERASGVAALLAAAACGAAWHHCRWHLFADRDLGFCARADDQPVCVDALVLTGSRRQLPPEPRPFRPFRRGEYARMEVEILRVRDGATWRAAAGRARVIVEQEGAPLRAGDRVRIFAHLVAPRPPMNPGEFDYAAHARADRRRAVLRAEFASCVTVTQPGGLASPTRLLESLRRGGERLLWRYLGGRRAGLASAVLLGVREEVTAEQTGAFMQTGTIHILSISGLHVGILAGTLLAMIRALGIPRAVGAPWVAAVTVLYTLLTDAHPPAVRAMILVLVFCAAYWLGRRALTMNSLAAAALAVLALNPADLFRVGVQLSFLCVIGLSWFASHPLVHGDRNDPLGRLVEEGRAWPVRAARTIGLWFWQITALGAAVWLLTLPLVMARFHLLSPVALALNAVLCFPMAAALWSGFGVLILGVIFPPLAPALGWCCEGTLALLEGMVEAARQIPASYFWVPGPPDGWLAGLYGGLAVMASTPRLRPPRRWLAALGSVWIAVGLLPGLLARNESRLSATFLAVDHGCAVVLELPSGAKVLYDAGRFAAPEMGTDAISAALWSKGIVHLDAVILSHADADHFNALPGLLKRFSVGVVYVSPVMFEDNNMALDALRAAIDAAGVPLGELAAGDVLSAGDRCLLDVLHPTKRGSLGGDNANSLVLAVRFAGRTILLAGDLEPPGLNDLLAEEPCPTDVLLAPHHGSRRSDPPGLAAWCSPKYVIISGGLRINLQETTAAYRAVGARILHTGQCGAIDVVVDDRGQIMTECFVKHGE
jgi:competence protein ComEC